MKITLDLLRQFHSCKDGIAFMENNYPDGEEAAKIISDGKVTLEMMHFAYKYFSLNEEEKQLYKEKCNIDNNSRFCWYSSNIKNSKAITNSTDIGDSSYIQNSNEVYISSDVSNSQTVQGSRDIYDAKNVHNSTVIVHSHDVSESNEIQFSSHVNWSQYITNSTLVEDSAYIYKSERVSECYCSGFLVNCRHCLFCSNLKDVDYCIFNEQVAPEVYEQWKENLLEQLGAENNHMILVNTKAHNAQDRYTITTRFDCVFEGLSDIFYGWVGTVPGATDLKFIRLFFRDYEFDK